MFRWDWAFEAINFALEYQGLSVNFLVGSSAISSGLADPTSVFSITGNSEVVLGLYLILSEIKIFLEDCV